WWSCCSTVRLAKATSCPGGRTRCLRPSSASPSIGPTSRARGCRGGCVPRAASGAIVLDRYSRWGGSRVDQLERSIRTAVGEQPCPLADDHREREQIHLVDEVGLQQPPGQGAATVDLELASRLGLQIANGGREVTR